MDFKKILSTLAIVFVLMFIIGASGCTTTETGPSTVATDTSSNPVSEPQAQPTTTPTKIAETFAKALIKGSGSEQIFNYLPPKVKSVYTSYDEWNDELANMKYSWNSQGIYFEYLGVQNEVVNGDNASVEVKYVAKGIVQKTTTQKYEFTKMNNEWKLNYYYELEM